MTEERKALVDVKSITGSADASLKTFTMEREAVALGMKWINVFWFTQEQLVSIREILKDTNPKDYVYFRFEEFRLAVSGTIFNLNVLSQLNGVFSKNPKYDDGKFEIPFPLFEKIRLDLNIEFMSERRLGEITENAGNRLKAIRSNQ